MVYGSRTSHPSQPDCPQLTSQASSISYGFYRILSYFFPDNLSENAIKPEGSTAGDREMRPSAAGTKRNGRVDLLVTHQVFSAEGRGVSTPWRVVYEGKRAKGGGTMDDAETQIQRYLATGVSANAKCFAIAARGRKCRFFRYRNGEGQEPLRTVYVSPKRRSRAKKNEEPKNENWEVKVSTGRGFPPVGYHDRDYDLKDDSFKISLILDYIEFFSRLDHQLGRRRILS